MTPDITLAAFMARVQDEGDCLMWTGHASLGRFPQWRIDGKLHAVRRLVWQLTRGEVKPGLQVGVSCGCDRCVHPDHLVARTKSKALVGKPVTPDHRARITIGRRAKSSLSMEIAREIRASDEPGNVLEARYGLNAGYASKIRTGAVWVDLSSPFAGLGARA